MAPQKGKNQPTSATNQMNKVAKDSKKNKNNTGNMKATKIVNQYFYGSTAKTKKAKTKHVSTNTLKLNPTLKENCMNTTESSFDFIKLDPVDYLHNQVIQQNYHNFKNWHSNNSKLSEFMYYFTYEMSYEKDPVAFKKAVKKLQKTFNSPNMYFKSKEEVINLLVEHGKAKGFLYECYEFCILSFFADLKSKNRHIDFGRLHKMRIVLDFLNKFFFNVLGK